MHTNQLTRRWFVGMAVLMAGFFGCSQLREELTGPIEAGQRDCVGCHTDEQILTTLAIPDTVAVENAGEG